VRSGIVIKPDTLAAQGTDSLLMEADSLLRSGADSLQVDSLHTDSLRADSLLVQADSVGGLGPRIKKDTIGLSGMVWLSTIAPGFGQIYNKQYWKVPILYGTVAAGLTLFIRENNRYKPIKRQVDALDLQVARLQSADETVPNELWHKRDVAQTRMVRSNTLRQLYIGAAALSYLYFLGDATLNYRYNDSSVKRATTLACIFPGAGQIYNKSYWRLPFVIGGLATTIYIIDWNNRGYKRYQKAYELRIAWEKAKDAYEADNTLPPPGDPLDGFGAGVNSAALKSLKDSYRRNRDMAIIITAGLYLLQIVDAHVDAHLKDYDISDDLSMNVTPSVSYAYSPSANAVRPMFGLNLSVSF
jgi:hypothetical protein